MDKLTAPHESVDTLADKVQKIEIDQSKLTALSPEVISRQATVSTRIRWRSGHINDQSFWQTDQHR